MSLWTLAGCEVYGIAHILHARICDATRRNLVRNSHPVDCERERVALYKARLALAAIRRKDSAAVVPLLDWLSDFATSELFPKGTPMAKSREPEQPVAPAEQAAKPRRPSGMAALDPELRCMIELDRTIASYNLPIAARKRIATRFTDRWTAEDLLDRSEPS